MTTSVSLRILRKPQAMEALGLPLSTFNLRVKQRLVTAPVSLGSRSVGWPSTDIDALVQAICKGASNSQITALVHTLELERKTNLSPHLSLL